MRFCERRCPLGVEWRAVIRRRSARVRRESSMTRRATGTSTFASFAGLQYFWRRFPQCWRYLQAEMLTRCIQCENHRCVDRSWAIRSPVRVSLDVAEDVDRSKYGFARKPVRDARARLPACHPEIVHLEVSPLLFMLPDFVAILGAVTSPITNDSLKTLDFDGVRHFMRGV